MQKLTISSKKESKVLLIFVTSLLITLMVIWNKGNFFIQNIIPCLLICIVVSSFLVKLIIEIIVNNRLKVSSYLNNEKQICIKIDKKNMKFLDFNFCYITLSCVIDDELIWQQKEKSINLCFTPSYKTEEIKKKIYRKDWNVDIDIPLKIKNFHIFVMKLKFNIKA